MKISSLVILLAALSGCAAGTTAITKANNHIQFPNCSFTLPAEAGWHIQQLDVSSQRAVFEKKEGAVIFQILVLRNTIRNRTLRASPAEVVADHYRDGEELNMMEQGVNKGLYQLKDLRRGTETLGGKTFYTAGYTTFRKDISQRAVLYLYFPKEKGNDSFIVAHYSETIPTGASMVKSCKSDFTNTLASLTVE
jgi:hypothetical protein